MFIYKMFNGCNYKSHYAREVEPARQIDSAENAEPRAKALNTQITLYRLRPYSRRGAPRARGRASLVPSRAPRLP